MLDFNQTTDNILETRAPAALSNLPAPTVTNKYGFINTNTAIEILADYGFHTVSASQQGSRKAENAPFAAHLLRFENPSLNRMFTGLKNGDTNPQLIVLNSHNKRTSLGIGQGFFRYACSNNLVYAAAGVFSRLRHNQATVSAYEDIVTAKVESLPSTMETISRMVSLEDLDPTTIRNFAIEACRLRGWEYVENIKETGKAASYYTQSTLHEMTQARRASDSANNLWNVFNRVQETFCNGTGCAPISIVSTSSKYPEGRQRKARAITAVAGNTKINAQLFELANKYLEAA